MNKSHTLAGVAVAAALGLSLVLPGSLAAQAPLGGGAVNGVPGGLKQAPGKPAPDPAQPRSLRLKPAS